MAAYSFPYLSPHQSRTRAPTEWEMSLADALESAFTRGHRDLDALVSALNGSRVRPREGGTWTAENFRSVMHELGA
jgi:hypothetical protein